MLRAIRGGGNFCGLARAREREREREVTKHTHARPSGARPTQHTKVAPVSKDTVRPHQSDMARPTRAEQSTSKAPAARRAHVGVYGKVALTTSIEFLQCGVSGRWGRRGRQCISCSKTWFGPLIQRTYSKGLHVLRGARQCECARGHRALGGSHSVRCCCGHRRRSGVDGHRGDLGGLLDQVGEGGVSCRLVLGLKESSSPSRRSPVP